MILFDNNGSDALNLFMIHLTRLTNQTFATIYLNKSFIPLLHLKSFAIYERINHRPFYNSVSIYEKTSAWCIK